MRAASPNDLSSRLRCLVTSRVLDGASPEANRDDIRELIFHAYRIIYLIAEEQVTILTVVHGSRDLGRRSPLPWEVE
jgi:plasmid stabilization system protein ParE